MKHKIILLLLTILPITTFAENGDIFTSKTQEGIEMTFQIISEIKKTCRVGYSSFSTPSISQNTTGELTIPDVVNGYRVTEISMRAFNGCSNLTSVSIPSSVTAIGFHSFYACSSLISLVIPNSVTSIDVGAFDKAAWFDNQPDGLFYAGYVAYKYKGTMPKNTHIDIKEGTVGIAARAFISCTDMTSVTIPSSVTTIGYEAFSGCNSLTTVTIPNSVTKIGDSAFSYCSDLTSVTIPNSVTTIGAAAFYYCI